MCHKHWPPPTFPKLLFYISEIAFEAYADKIDAEDGYYPKNTTIIFDKVLFNDNTRYNPVTGVFNAPFSGVYKFTVHVCNKPGKDMVFALVKGTGSQQKKLATSLVYNRYTSSCSSISPLVKLDENDEVRVISEWTRSYLFAGGHRWISFSGILMYRDWVLTPDDDDNICIPIINILIIIWIFDDFFSSLFLII